MSVTKTLLQVGALALALSLTGCPSNSPTGPTAAATSPKARGTVSAGPTCDTAERRMFTWFPRHLPLPKGSFASRELAGSPGLRRAMFFVPLGIRNFRHFIRAKWPPAGYVVGRIAVGPNQLSGSFVKGPARGTFVAHVDCSHLLQFILGYAAGSPSPSSS